MPLQYFALQSMSRCSHCTTSCDASDSLSLAISLLSNRKHSSSDPSFCTTPNRPKDLSHTNLGSSNSLSLTNRSDSRVPLKQPLLPAFLLMQLTSSFHVPPRKSGCYQHSLDANNQRDPVCMQSLNAAMPSVQPTGWYFVSSQAVVNISHSSTQPTLFHEKFNRPKTSVTGLASTT
jgi:hypothetical protein